MSTPFAIFTHFLICLLFERSGVSGHGSAVPTPYPVTPQPWYPLTHPPHRPLQPLYPRPPPSCDLCTKLTTGFDKAYQLVIKIDDKLTCPTPPTDPTTTTPDPTTTPPTTTPPPVCDPGAFFTSGNAVSTGGAVSVATCPVGTFPIACRCSDESANCEGVRQGGRNCRAERTMGTTGTIQAVALCASDPTGKYDLVQDPMGGFDADPVATCPVGTQIIECHIWNNAPLMLLVQTRMSVDARTCQPSEPCTAGMGCRVIAVCETI